MKYIYLPISWFSDLFCTPVMSTHQAGFIITLGGSLTLLLHVKHSTFKYAQFHVILLNLFSASLPPSPDSGLDSELDSSSIEDSKHRRQGEFFFFYNTLFILMIPQKTMEEYEVPVLFFLCN